MVVHSVQNNVDNSVSRMQLVCAMVNVGGMHRRPGTCDAHHSTDKAAGQSHASGEPDGQGAAILVHTHLWTALWKGLYIVVDNGVDGGVHNPFVHVRRGGTGEIDRKRSYARQEGSGATVSCRRRARTRIPPRAWEVRRCGGA